MGSPFPSPTVGSTSPPNATLTPFAAPGGKLTKQEKKEQKREEKKELKQERKEGFESASPSPSPQSSP
jgi:carbamate kinase